MTPNPATPPAPARRRRKIAPGWIPDQHGAWAMIAIPALSGAVLAGFQWVHLPLLIFWWIGYFFYQAAMLWLKSRRKPKYFPPVRAYAIAMIPFGLAVAVLRPYLAFWALAFAPLVAVGVWATVHRQERTYYNDTATILAAVLMLPVAFHAGAAQGDPRWSAVWLAALVQFLYFWGTIPHIKALIRERDRPEAARLSVAYHAAAFVLVTVLVAFGRFEDTLLAGWFLAAVWALLTVRAYVMPWWQRNHSRMRPLVIGNTEVAFSLLITIALLLRV